MSDQTNDGEGRGKNRLEFATRAIHGGQQHAQKHKVAKSHKTQN